MTTGKNRPVMAGVQSLRNEIGILAEVAKEFSERLKPALKPPLTPASPTTESQKQEKRPLKSDLSEVILCEARKLYRVRLDLQEILNRLEI